MPSLADLADDRLALRMYDKLTVSRQWVESELLFNMGRLIDRAIVRYGEARDCFDTWRANRHLGEQRSRFLGVSALEETVTLTHRAIRLGEAAAERQALDPALMPSMAVREQIKELRDAIQHTEDRLTGKRQPPVVRGEYSFPTYGDSEIALGSHRLSYDTLASALRSLHASLQSPPYKAHHH